MLFEVTGLNEGNYDDPYDSFNDDDEDGEDQQVSPVPSP